LLEDKDNINKGDIDIGPNNERLGKYCGTGSIFNTQSRDIARRKH